MDEELRLQAVEDVLNHLRTPTHSMNKGRLLALALLGRQWEKERDDEELAEALQDLLATELSQLRAKGGIGQKVALTSAEAEEHLRADLAARDERLKVLALTWAFYVEGIKTEQLATIASCSDRTINTKVRAGRSVLAKLILRQEPRATPPPEHKWQEQRNNKETGGGPSAEHGAVQSQNEPTPALAYRYHVQLNAGKAVVYNAPVTQIVDRNRPAARQYTGTAKADDQLESAILLLIFVGAFCLISTLPWVSIGIILTLTAWRVVVHCGQCVQQWRIYGNDEESWWAICSAAPWLALLSLAISTALMARIALATPTFSLEHLLLIVRCMVLGMFLVLLGTIDLIFWVQGRMIVSWPLGWFKTRADRAWEQRWQVVGIGWLGLIAVGILWFMLANLGGK